MHDNKLFLLVWAFWNLARMDASAVSLRSILRINFDLGIFACDLQHSKLVPFYPPNRHSSLHVLRQDYDTPQQHGQAGLSERW